MIIIVCACWQAVPFVQRFHQPIVNNANLSGLLSNQFTNVRLRIINLIQKGMYYGTYRLFQTPGEKSFFKDYKTQTPPTSEDAYYEYHPAYFDVPGIFLAFTDLEEEILPRIFDYLKNSTSEIIDFGNQADSTFLFFNRKLLAIFAL